MRQSEKWLWSLTSQEILDADDAEQAEGHSKDNKASHSKEWKDRSLGDQAVLFHSIHLQGQMVFASLTFTADGILFAGFSQVASFPLLQFILPLAPLWRPVSCSSRWQGDTWSSQQVDVSREPAKPSSYGPAPTPTRLWLCENIVVGALRTVNSVLLKNTSC